MSSPIETRDGSFRIDRFPSGFGNEQKIEFLTQVRNTVPEFRGSYIDALRLMNQATQYPEGLDLSRSGPQTPKAQSPQQTTTPQFGDVRNNPPPPTEGEGQFGQVRNAGRTEEPPNLRERIQQYFEGTTAAGMMGAFTEGAAPYAAATATLGPVGALAWGVTDAAGTPLFEWVNNTFGTNWATPSETMAFLAGKLGVAPPQSDFEQDLVGAGKAAGMSAGVTGLAQQVAARPGAQSGSLAPTTGQRVATEMAAQPGAQIGAAGPAAAVEANVQDNVTARLMETGMPPWLAQTAGSLAGMGFSVPVDLIAGGIANRNNAQNTALSTDELGVMDNTQRFLGREASADEVIMATQPSQREVTQVRKRTGTIGGSGQLAADNAYGLERSIRSLAEDQNFDIPVTSQGGIDADPVMQDLLIDFTTNRADTLIPLVQRKDEILRSFPGEPVSPDSALAAISSARQAIQEVAPRDGQAFIQQLNGWEQQLRGQVADTKQVSDVLSQVRRFATRGDPAASNEITAVVDQIANRLDTADASSLADGMSDLQTVLGEYSGSDVQELLGAVERQINTLARQAATTGIEARNLNALSNVIYDSRSDASIPSGIQRIVNQQVGEIQKAITDDMESFFQLQGAEPLWNELSVTNRQLSEMADEFNITGLEALLRQGNRNPDNMNVEQVSEIIRNSDNRGGALRVMRQYLNEQGVDNLERAMVADVLKRSNFPDVNTGNAGQIIRQHGPLIDLLPESYQEYWNGLGTLLRDTAWEQAFKGGSRAESPLSMNQVPGQSFAMGQTSGKLGTVGTLLFGGTAQAIAGRRARALQIPEVRDKIIALTRHQPDSPEGRRLINSVIQLVQDYEQENMNRPTFEPAEGVSPDMREQRNLPPVETGRTEAPPSLIEGRTRGETQTGATGGNYVPLRDRR